MQEEGMEWLDDMHSHDGQTRTAVRVACVPDVETASAPTGTIAPLNTEDQP